MGKKHQRNQVQKQKSNKNKNKDSSNGNSDKNNRKYQKEDTDKLISQAIQGVNLLSSSDDELKEPIEKIVYCIDMDWFTDWQDYVGACAVWMDSDPSEEEGFGKKRPKDQNSLILKKDTKNYHMFPQSMHESAYLNTVLKTDVKENNLRIVNEETWQFFKENYPDLVEIKRSTILVNDKVSNEVGLGSVWLGIVDQDTVSKFNKKKKKLNESNSDKETDDEQEDTSNDEFDFLKIQTPKAANFQYFFDLWTNFYINTRQPTRKREDFKFRLWKIDQTLHIQRVVDLLTQEFKDETYRIKGTKFNKKVASDVSFKYLTSPHYKFVLEAIEKDDVGILVEHEEKKVGALCLKEDGILKGICERCGEDKFLLHQCLCLQNYYCSLNCMYKDKIFHSNVCNKSFDSESDEEVEQTINPSSKATGLINLGNTCYMNSGLQCLVATSYLTNYFKTNQYLADMQSEDGDTLITTKFAKLIKNMHFIKDIVEPWAFKIQFGSYFNQFSGFDQQDAQEFISNMIEIFNDQFRHATNKNELEEQNNHHNLENGEGGDDDELKAQEMVNNLKTSMCSNLFIQSFFGLFRSQLSCSECSRQSVSFEYFSTLSLPIAEKRSEISATITFQPYQLNQPCRSTRVSISTTSNMSVQELIDLACSQLEIKSKVILGLCSTERVINYYTNLNNKALGVMQECSQTKRAVLFEMEKEFDHSRKNTILLSYSIKNRDNSNDVKQFSVLLPRALVIDIDESLADIYVQISKQMKGMNIFDSNEIPVSEDQCQEITLNCLTDDQADSDKNIKLISEQCHYEFILISEKQRRKKQPDICVFCQKTTCRGCNLPFKVSQSYGQFTSNYNHSLNFQLHLKDPKQVKFVSQREEELILDEQLLRNDNSSCPTLSDCLKLYCQVEQLDEENMWNCETCGDMRIANKEVSIYYSPRYLVIQLKRFKDSNKGKVKNNQIVNYSLVEDLTAYIHQISPFLNDQEITKRILYRLYGVVLHSGQINSGHYTAYTLQNMKWTYYNDDDIKEVEAKEVVSHKNAYILFYELI